MASAVKVIVTGVAELDWFLALLEPKEVRKAVTKATDATITNHVLPEYRNKIEQAGFVGTGATRDMAKKKRVSRNRRMTFGSELVIDRVKVVQTRRERGGKIGYDKKRNEDFFHPIAIEFGDEKHQPGRPLYKALKGNEAAALAEFHKYLRAVLVGAKMSGKSYGKFKI